MKNILTAIALLGIAIILPAQNRIYVHHAANGANNGQTWSDAFSDLQTALLAAQGGDEVWVSEGTYYPTNGTDRSVSFEPKSGVQLYGGFEGNETTLGQRDWAAHVTYLSGDIGIPGDSTDNSLNIVYLFQSDSNTVLDGFAVCFGLADNLPGANSSRDRAICGAGLYIEAGNWDAFPNIQNCRFMQNTANSFGGGVMVNGATAAGVAPRFVNCRFEENRSLGSGGGLARFGGSWAERGKEFEGCAFSQNRAAVHGGGLHYSDTQGSNTVEIYACSFEGNRAANRGGGAYFLAGKAGKSGLYIQNCGFEANIALEGAAIDIFTNGNDFDGEAVIDSCVFLKNISPSGGNAPSIIYSDQFGTPQTLVKLSNSKLEANRSHRDIVFFGWLDAMTITEGTLFYRDTAIEILGNSAISSSQLVRSRFSSNRADRLVDIDYSDATVVPSFHGINCVFDENKRLINFITGFGFSYHIDSVFFTNFNFLENEVYNFVTGPFGSNLDVVLKNMIMKKSVFSSYDRFYFSSSVLGYPDCQSLPSNVTCGPNNLFNLDPQFRDTANHDYSLLPCSPLINAGSNAAAMGILTDIAGNPRIQGGTVDIGAYESPAFALAAEPQVQPACVGSSNGSIAITPVFGCEPYTYDWLPDAGNGPQLNGLLPGNYLLTITDGSGRQILDTVQVASAPLPVLNPVVTDVQCGTTLGGSIAANVSNGTAPFHYQWQPLAADTSLITRLSPGAYSLTVSDANGCQDSASANISLLGLLSLMVDGQGISCFGETDGWLSATPLTGASPFSWDWQGWAGTDSVAQPLGPGMYAVTVSDVFGCTATYTFPPMNQPDSLYATVGTQDQTNLSMPNGAAVVTTISGGMAPYGFDWSTGSTQQAIAGLTAGDYTVTVTDKNGCEVVVEVVVDLMVSSTEEEAGSVLLMYPNPAVDWVKIVFPASKDGCSVELADNLGRVLKSTILPSSSDHCQLDLRELPSGSYVVTVRFGANRGVFVGKVLKQ